MLECLANNIPPAAELFLPRKPYGGVQVVDMDRLVQGSETELLGLSINRAAFDAVGIQ